MSCVGLLLQGTYLELLMESVGEYMKDGWERMHRETLERRAIGRISGVMRNMCMDCF